MGVVPLTWLRPLSPLHKGHDQASNITQSRIMQLPKPEQLYATLMQMFIISNFLFARKLQVKLY